MSLVNLSHVCSHLQNASKARLGLTSIPSTNLHLSICLNLQKQGFLSTVLRGGPSPPDTSTLHTGEPLPASADAEATVTQENVATRRLWLGLKYWNSQPVLSEMKMVSKPKQRIQLSSLDIGRIVRGREAGYVKGLTRPGECLFVSTDKGVLEARECVERKVGGLVLCRVN
ncbi:40S ribosomal protein S8 [Viridothelium virens]|uniref:Small ribosomal subunit protein uS8m n=1 Tax=Viridothelium virens TaxID=1048519 RepID=A0A6A6GXL4_VIRVR|nr:40S ribosomal protein S8 [Viridothelium virens]